MNLLHDQYLLFRLRMKRDPQAFALLYDRYVKAIYRFVYLKVSQRELAEDITSESFLRCWQRLQQPVSPIINVRALLYQIARNLIIDAYRQAQSRPTVSLEDHVTLRDPATSSYSETDAASTLGRGSERMESEAELQLLFRRIACLKEDYQDVLVLRLIEGLGFVEIAKILEKTPANVRVIHHRAMKALEEYLA